jgi:hypothetical protein
MAAHLKLKVLALAQLSPLPWRLQWLWRLVSVVG